MRGLEHVGLISAPRLHHGLDRSLACQSHRSIEKARDNGDEDRYDGVVPIGEPNLSYSTCKLEDPKSAALVNFL